MNGGSGLAANTVWIKETGPSPTTSDTWDNGISATCSLQSGPKSSEKC